MQANTARSFAGFNFVFAGLSLPVKGMLNKSKTICVLHKLFTGLAYQKKFNPRIVSLQEVKFFSNLKFEYLRENELVSKIVLAC